MNNNQSDYEDRIKFERQYWDEKARSKDIDREMHDPWLNTDEEIKIILAHAPAKPKIILEIGCGVGRLLIPIAKMFPESKVIGQDISFGLLKILGRRVGENYLRHVEFTWPADGRTLVTKDYDFIYCVTVFQHLDEGGVSGYIGEVGRVLKKKGLFVFQFIEGSEHEPMSHHYDFAYIKKLLDKSGMGIAEVKKGLVHKSWTWVTARKQ